MLRCDDVDGAASLVERDIFIKRRGVLDATGSWFSGYNVAFTRQRSPVRIWAGPFFWCLMKTITDEKLAKYFAITREALAMAKAHIDASRKEHAHDAIDMVERYVSDAEHFKTQGDFVNAFAALNYAHGWLDCGARTGLFLVKNSRLFTVDD